ncbi:hypothetical protein, partial [Sphaerospermopsis reniformis]|uniref:hypothetical protein n=1 Tax=Sphaerospermopsis reniformis TaxID=531300 RepID=UPI001396C68A
GIPTSTLLAQVKPEILTAYSLPVPNISQPVPDVPALTGWLGDTIFFRNAILIYVCVEICEHNLTNLIN